MVKIHRREINSPSSIVKQQALECKNDSFLTDDMVKRSDLFKTQQSYKKLRKRDSVLLVRVRVQSDQSLFFCVEGKSPRTVVFAECTIPLSGHMRIQQDSSV